MATVAFKNVDKQFGSNVVLQDLNLDVHDGEFLVLLGPSGCGKTTALRMVAGLETPSSGEILIGDQVVNDVAPRHRDVAMVFQSYALYPHLSVGRNIEFPLRQQDLSSDERKRKVTEAAEMLGLTDLLDRKPRQLSGGQRQRVALARAIVRDPLCFLMDEPLSNLDATLRTQTRADIVRLQQRLGTTTLFVTHDQVEAMTMGHRIAVLHEGSLQQVGTPTELYEDPANAFVASFVGNPGMSLLAATALDGAISVEGTPTQWSGTSSEGPITIGVRPDGVAIRPSGIAGVCMGLEVLGAEVHVLADVGASRLVISQAANAPRPALGAPIALELLTQPLIFDATTGVRQR